MGDNFVLVGITGPVSITGPVNVIGAVNVNNFPTYIGITGPVSINSPVSVTGSVAVNNFPTYYSLTGQYSITGTIGVTGTVSVNNFPTYMGVTGKVSIADQSSVNIGNTPYVKITNGTDVADVDIININSNINGKRGIYTNSLMHIRDTTGASVQLRVLSGRTNSRQESCMNTYIGNTSLGEEIVTRLSAGNGNYISTQVNSGVHSLATYDVDASAALNKINSDTTAIKSTLSTINGKLDTTVNTFGRSGLNTYRVMPKKKYISIGGQASNDAMYLLLTSKTTTVYDVTTNTFGLSTPRIFYASISPYNTFMGNQVTYDYVDASGILNTATQVINSAGYFPLAGGRAIANVNQWKLLARLGTSEFIISVTQDTTGVLCGGIDGRYFNALYTVPVGKIAWLTSVSFFSGDAQSLGVMIWNPDGSRKIITYLCIGLKNYNANANTEDGLCGVFTEGQTIGVFAETGKQSGRIYYGVICEADY